MERRITIEVSYSGSLPEALSEYLNARPDILVASRSPLVIKATDADVLSAILRVARCDRTVSVTSVNYRRQPTPSFAAVAE